MASVKDLKVLVAILTSSDVPRCVRAVNSAMLQKEPGYEYDTVVFINSLTPGYSEKVQREVGCKTVTTRSNGLPGLGKQSVANWFMAHEEYDAFVPIDGDDFLYPFALRVLGWFYQTQKMDVLGLQSHDIITTKGTTYRSVELSPDYSLIGWFGEQKNHCISRTYADYTQPVGGQRTPDRLIWLTRMAFQAAIRPWFPTDLEVYEDYVASLSCLAAHHRGMLKYVQTASSSIYVHDGLRRDSVTNRFTDKGLTYQSMHDQFAKRISWLLPLLGTFGFNDLPYVAYPYEDRLTSSMKSVYVWQNLIPS